MAIRELMHTSTDPRHHRALTLDHVNQPFNSDDVIDAEISEGQSDALENVDGVIFDEADMAERGDNVEQ